MGLVHRLAALAGKLKTAYVWAALIFLCLNPYAGDVYAQAIGGNVTPMRVPPPTGGYENAVMDSQTVPTSMEAGKLYTVTIDMVNWGENTWTADGLYGLIPIGTNSTAWGISEVPIVHHAEPGEVASFTFQVRAPSVAGSYTFYWSMKYGRTTRFGTPSTPITVTVAPSNDAAVVSQNIPGQMLTGQTYSASVTMKNTGGTTWTRAQQYTLMAQAPHNNMTWGLNRVPLPVESVGPGETVTFNFQIAAPASAGQYVSQWGMQREGQGSFGASTLTQTVTVRAPVSNAQPLGQQVPTQMQTGQRYDVSVTMQNTGETIWSRVQQYTLMAQSPQNNVTWGFNRVSLPVDTIAPGQATTFGFQVIAPSSPGTYVFQWGMQREGYGSFGPGAAPVTVTVVAPPALVNAAEVIGMTAPARMETGKLYDVAVTMRNSGTTTWTPEAAYRLGVQNASGELWGIGRVFLTAPVLPGQQYTFNFSVKAPAPGSYNLQWGMVQEEVAWFGGAASSTVTVTENLGNVTFIHTDGLGSPVARTNLAGAVVSRTRYEPYGYVAAGATPTIGFTGHVNDSDTGLTYMQQRYYDPVAGRFLSIDPVVTDANTGGSFNRYAYASNSPYKYVDPDGRQERAAEAFSDQFRNDAASGNSGVYEPFHTPVVIATIGMVVGPPIAAAIIAGAPAEAAVAGAAAGKATTIVAKNGVEIKSIARHAVDRAIGDGGKRAGVGPKGILDSLKNPLKITETKTDELGRASQRFIGKDATTAVNPETGKIVSVNPTSTKTAEKLIKAAEQ